MPTSRARPPIFYHPDREKASEEAELARRDLNESLKVQFIVDQYRIFDVADILKLSNMDSYDWTLQPFNEPLALPGFRPDWPHIERCSGMKATAEMSSPDQGADRHFENLPPEIRRRIFEFLFYTETTGEHVRANTCLETASNRLFTCNIYVPSVALKLFTSRQFFREALPVFAASSALCLRILSIAPLLSALSSSTDIGSCILHTMVMMLLTRATTVTLAMPSGHYHLNLPELYQYLHRVQHINLCDLKREYHQYSSRNGSLYLSQDEEMRECQRMIRPEADFTDTDGNAKLPTGLEEIVGNYLTSINQYSQFRELVDRYNTTGQKCSVKYWIKIRCEIPLDSRGRRPMQRIIMVTDVGTLKVDQFSSHGRLGELKILQTKALDLFHGSGAYMEVRQPWRPKSHMS